KAIQLERDRLKEISVTEEERFRILKNIRETYKVAQRRDEMLKATADVLNFAKRSFKKNKKNPPSSRRLLEAHVIYTRAVWTENRRDLALKSLNEARRDLQGKVSLEEIHFLFARMAEEIQNLTEAEAYLEKALSEPPSVPGLREKMTWSRAWLLHKMDRKDDALKAFTEISETSKDNGEIARSLFWKARSLPEEPERRRLLEDVRDRDPLGFYGLMAMRDLGAPLPPIQSKSDKTDLFLWQSSEIPLRQALIAEWMIALDWHEGLVSVLDSIQAELKKNKRASTEAWLRLTTSYARGGEFLPLFALMGQVPPELRDRLIAEKPELLFPRPWPEEAGRAAKAARVPPELIYAIMRQESAFNPRARSHAEAYGLMQLLPNVASRLASKYKSPYKGPESLYEPAVIIPLGAFELRTLFDRWNEVWVPSIASYNASEQAVRGWMKMRRREDPIEFIEEIPYEETRGYIKLVMRNQVFYQRLLASEPTPFPENCLNIFQKTPRPAN
ncbi:MAG TPA: lytic transglycosylase domain-containing protein, partial [Pseudobdellovibrionaceae bacterium]|nr:lytic transglycosylase domain-containing protein [Pseudobdellovibrionaceae bacterium]